ncbi:hypothetical protein IBT47_05510 [Erwinia sp. S43]|uniref:hypothetical protein n=1 Tax=Erwinia sp. S43 TaxID=2769339 RepID=UPI001909F3B6|nr:hypothetical protein [Erwinia sp. S43]MBK0031738.1 hypothetical protein [Erwinia sp. S43]
MPQKSVLACCVEYDSPDPVLQRYIAGLGAKGSYAATRLVGLDGSIKYRHRGFCFSAPVSPPLLFSAQTEKIAFNAVGFRTTERALPGLSDCDSCASFLTDNALSVVVAGVMPGVVPPLFLSPT